MIDLLFKWQTFFWAIIWASSPFLLWWLAWTILNKEKSKNELYYLEKLLIYHINDLLDNRKTIIAFINWNLSNIINDINNTDNSIYALGYTYIPLFSIIPINKEVLKYNTKSSYLDNKISYTYKLSENMPHIINDIRKQFDSLVETNKILVLWKFGTPEYLKKMYIDNLENYKKMIQNEILDNNIPIYLKVLVQTHEALKYIRQKWYIKWHLKFNPKFKFYKNAKSYNLAIENIYDEIQWFFKWDVDKNCDMYINSWN